MSRNTDNFQEKYKMNRSAFFNSPAVLITILGVTVAGFNNRCLGNEEILGKLRVESYLYNTSAVSNK